MTTKVKTFVQLKNPKWRVELFDVVSRCQEVAKAVWGVVLDSDQVYEATIVLADDALLKKLNNQFRHKNKSTNILTFPCSKDDLVVPGDNPMLGDIIISFETAKQEAPENLSNHLSHLVVHGCLHLLGYDHENDTEAQKMESLETQILASLDVADPYGQVT
jgi:probable rRNA maturation factor